MGTLQAVEIIKLILELPDTLTGKLLIYDALSARFQTIALKWDPDNPLTGIKPAISDLSIHAGYRFLCAVRRLLRVSSSRPSEARGDA